MTGQEALEILKRSRRSPGLFFRNILGVEPTEKQEEVLLSIRDHKRVAVKSSHATGKSFTADRVALWFLYTNPQSVVITTAPTDRQVKAVLWKEIAAALRDARIPMGGNLLQQRLEVTPDHFAIGFSSSDTDDSRFHGFHAKGGVLVVVDEAGGVSPTVYEGIEGVLTGTKSRLLQIGNPTSGSTAFAREFSDKFSPSTKKITISAFDSPNLMEFGIDMDAIRGNYWEELIQGRKLPNPYLVDASWVYDKFLRWGEDDPRFQSRVLGEFPDAADDALIPKNWIELAQERDLPSVSSDSTMGVDVARYGSDLSVIALRNGSTVRIVETHAKLDIISLAGFVIKAWKRNGRPGICIDEIGLGAGLVDFLASKGLPAVGVNVAKGSSSPDRFKNLRAELYWKLRQQFEEGTIDIDPAGSEHGDELFRDLQSIRWHPDNQDRVQLVSKEQMKKKGMGSPDFADAVALTYFEAPVVRKGTGRRELRL